MPDDAGLDRGSAGALLTLPNVISFGRLCAVPLAFWLVIDHRLAAAFVLFMLAGASDAVDGWLARRSGGGNVVGAVLDPVADKALLVTMYVTLAAVGEMPDWVAVLVVFRDMIIVGGVVVLAILGLPVTIRPLFVSKVNTLLQIVLVALTLFLSGFGIIAPSAVTAMWALSWAVAASTLASGGAYVFKVVRVR
ncbi:MAG: CDP-alcohol phosphatidyltransferase family protein [Acetobacteraceae bacterium]